MDYFPIRVRCDRSGQTTRTRLKNVKKLLLLDVPFARKWPSDKKLLVCAKMFNTN